MTEMYDSRTTADQVQETADKLMDIIQNSGLSANVLFTMFSFHAAQMMEDIIGAAKVHYRKKGDPDGPL